MESSWSTARNIRDGHDRLAIASQEYVANEDYEQIMRRCLPQNWLTSCSLPKHRWATWHRSTGRIIALAQSIIRFRMRLDRFDHKFTLYAMLSQPLPAPVCSAYLQGPLRNGLTGESNNFSSGCQRPPTKSRYKSSQFLDIWTVGNWTNLVDREAVADREAEGETPGADLEDGHPWSPARSRPRRRPQPLPELQTVRHRVAR